VTEVTRPELFEPTTRARPDAEVMVSQLVAVEGHAPVPGDGDW
jgi:hypothetical protein